MNSHNPYRTPRTAEPESHQRPLTFDDFENLPAVDTSNYSENPNSLNLTEFRSNQTQEDRPRSFSSAGDQGSFVDIAQRKKPGPSEIYGNNCNNAISQENPLDFTRSPRDDHIINQNSSAYTKVSALLKKENFKGKEFQRPSCEIHPREEAGMFYCADCSDFSLCVQCVVQDIHHGHQILNKKKAVVFVKANMEEELVKLESKRKFLNLKEEILQHAMSELNNTAREFQDRLFQQFEQIFKKLNAKKDQLLFEMQENGKQKLERAQLEYDLLTKQIPVVVNRMEMILKAYDAGEDDELIRLFCNRSDGLEQGSQEESLTYNEDCSYLIRNWEIETANLVNEIEHLNFSNKSVGGDSPKGGSQTIIDTTNFVSTNTNISKQTSNTKFKVDVSAVRAPEEFLTSGNLNLSRVRASDFNRGVTEIDAKFNEIFGELINHNKNDIPIRRRDGSNAGVQNELNTSSVNGSVVSRETNRKVLALSSSHASKWSSNSIVGGALNSEISRYSGKFSSNEKFKSSKGNIIKQNKDRSISFGKSQLSFSRNSEIFNKENSIDPLKLKRSGVFKRLSGIQADLEFPTERNLVEKRKSAERNYALDSLMRQSNSFKMKMSFIGPKTAMAAGNSVGGGHYKFEFSKKVL